MADQGNDLRTEGSGAQLPGPPSAASRLFGDRTGLARRYAEELATTGITHGLVGPREAPRLWERHLLNCVLLGGMVPERSTVIDIGSGAGLPGIVLAIARPDVTVHLVEPLLRRTTWLERTIGVLGLDNVVVHRGRAEQMDLSAPVVTARAVASLDTLVRWALPLLEPEGRLLALKGAAADEELAVARPVLDELGVTQARVVRLDEEGVDPVNVVEVVRPRGLTSLPRGRVDKGGRRSRRSRPSQRRRG